MNKKAMNFAAENKRLKEENNTVWSDSETWLRRERRKSFQNDDRVESLTHEIRRMTVELEIASEAQQEVLRVGVHSAWQDKQCLDLVNDLTKHLSPHMCCTSSKKVTN